MRSAPTTPSRTARRDRALRILLTSGGGPGVWGLLAALRSMPQRRATLLVHDPAEHPTLGTLLADAATRLPRAADPTYIDALLDFCGRERVDVLIPVYDGELLSVGRRRDAFAARGTVLLLPPTPVVELCRDKARTYAALAGSAYPPPFRVATTVEESLAAIAALGYPRATLAVRPTDQAGGRGLHILDARADAFQRHFLEKPGTPRLVAEEFLRLRAAGPAEFPLIFSAYLPGEELGFDVLAHEGRVLERVTRRKSGPMLHGNPTCIRFGERRGEGDWLAGLVAALHLSGLLSVDARYDAGGTLRLLEVNPRPGAYIGMSCRRVHLLAWAIDRLCGAGADLRADYLGDESFTHGLRAFGDLVHAEGREPLAILQPAGAPRVPEFAGS